MISKCDSLDVRTCSIQQESRQPCREIVIVIIVTIIFITTAIISKFDVIVTVIGVPFVSSNKKRPGKLPARTALICALHVELLGKLGAGVHEKSVCVELHETCTMKWQGVAQFDTIVTSNSATLQTN